ncbi:hypothetical protein GGI07_004158 [Coemansia sp. Benny D115]|nr:hypothetical protein GGI07_004158 [Coemansia sp. Benny D115]
MQITKTFVAIAALATSVFGAIDWSSQATLECAKANWAGIKQKADPLLPFAGAVLPAENAAALAALLNGATTMPSNPTDEFLLALPGAIPVDMLNELAGAAIEACLATQGSGNPEPTTDAAAPTTDAAAPTTDAAAPTTDATAPTSVPPTGGKCAPRK